MPSRFQIQILPTVLQQTKFIDRRLYSGILTILCCCRWFRRHKNYDTSSYPDDVENGPIILKQVFEETPYPPFLSFGRTTNLSPILEASPRPSEDARHPVTAPGKPPTHPLLNREVRNTVLQRSETAPATMLPTPPSTPIPASVPFVQQATPAPQNVLPPRKDGTPAREIQY